MPITLGTNIASLRGQRQLALTSDDLSTVFQRLSSGQRINKASDDAAGLAIADSLNADARVFNQGMRNLNDGLSVLSIADGTVEQLSEIVIRIRELAEQAANGIFSTTQRKSLNEEAQALREEYFRVSRSTEFNGLNLFDGTLDEGLRLQGGYGIDGGIQTSLGGQMGDGTFSEIATISMAGIFAQDIQSVDINGDGNLDILTGNGGSISIMLGNGDGTFAASYSYASGGTSIHIELDDVNRDGKLDVVAALRDQDSVAVMLGAGDGTFSSITSFGSGDYVTGVTLEDFNGDGIVDLATTHRDGQDSNVFLGDGHGSFQHAQTLAGGVDNFAIIASDLNSDGNVDVISTNRSSDDLTYFQGNGDGTFRSVVTLNGAGNGPLQTVASDLNQDGNIDLITANNFGGDITVLMGNGDGTFQSVVTYGTGANSSAVEVADVDSDGFSDLVVVQNGGNNMSVLIGNGDGTFGSESFIAAGDSPRSLASGDYNEDGVLDLVVSELGAVRAIRVFLGNTREGIAPLLEFSLESQIDALQAIAPLTQKLQQLSNQRGIIGAYQSRLHTASNMLVASVENLSAAEGQIRDTDVAENAAQLARLSILNQASASVLSQANIQPQLALQLLQ